MQVMFLSPQEKDIFGPLLQLAGPGTPEQVATPKPDGGPKRRGSPPGSGSRQWPKWPRKGKGGKGKEKGRESEHGSEEAEGPPASSDCTASTASRGCHIHSASRQGHAVLPEDRGQESFLPTLFNLSQAWNKEREKPIAQRQEPLSPLRIVLVKAFLSEMAARITKVMEDPEVRKKVIAAGWATQEADQTLSWHFQMYDAEKKQEHVDQSKPPLPHARIMQLLEGVAESLRPEVVQRFHANEAPSGVVPGSGGSVHDGGGASRRICQGTLQEHGRFGPQHGLESHGQPHAAGNDWPVAPCQSHCAAACRSVRALRLINDHNLCYQHSFILSFMWGVVQCNALTRGDHAGVQLDATAGRLAMLCNPLLSATTPLRLGSVWEWTRYLQGWRQPRSQHDIAEFAMHVLRKLRPQCMEGSWQSRSSHGECVTLVIPMCPCTLPPRQVGNMTYKHVCYNGRRRTWFMRS